MASERHAWSLHEVHPTDPIEGCSGSDSEPELRRVRCRKGSGAMDFPIEMEGRETGEALTCSRCIALAKEAPNGTV